jgi:RNA polymerase sigma-70 factor (ECF subfamily)
LSRFSRVTGADDVDEIYARFCLQLLANDKKKLRLFDPERGSKLSSWLGLLASHAAYDYLRSLRRNSNVEPLTETERLTSDTPSPFEMSLLHERARVAAQVMAQLSERDREFVELYFGEGLEPEEIAREMGISVKTVYSKKHKITARLESLLASAKAAA